MGDDRADVRHSLTESDPVLVCETLQLDCSCQPLCGLCSPLVASPLLVHTTRGHSVVNLTIPHLQSGKQEGKCHGVLILIWPSAVSAEERRLAFIIPHLMKYIKGRLLEE